MVAILARMIPTLISILAGVGVGEVVDKVAADKIPNYQNPYKDEGAINWRRVIWTVITVAVGTIIAAMVVKKLRLRLKI